MPSQYSFQIPRLLPFSRKANHVAAVRQDAPRKKNGGKIEGFGIHLGACGQLVQNLRMNAGTKCVRLSPEWPVTHIHTSPRWINYVLFPHIFTTTYTPISTSNHTHPASVRPLVLPTFHSTYNHHNQFI